MIGTQQTNYDMRAHVCVTDFVFALCEAEARKKKMQKWITHHVLPVQSRLRIGHQRRVEIKTWVKDHVEGVIKLFLDIPKSAKKIGKKNLDMKKKMEKWDLDVYIPTFTNLIYRIIILRHRIKMAWFDANCEDKPLKIHDELPEE